MGGFRQRPEAVCVCVGMVVFLIESIMRNRVLALLLGAVLFQPLGLVLAADVDVRPLLDEARRASDRLLGEIRGELVRELERSGPVRAIIVCKYSAPETAASISREMGMRVTRVSLRPRNPTIGDPDVWEQKHLLDFEKRVAAGEKADGMERSEVVVEPAGRYFRYMKAIPTGQPCLVCHGPLENIPEAVRAKLNGEYPHDRGVNYGLGQVRGAVSVKKPL